MRMEWPAYIAMVTCTVLRKLLYLLPGSAIILTVPNSYFTTRAPMLWTSLCRTNDLPVMAGYIQRTHIIIVRGGTYGGKVPVAILPVHEHPFTRITLRA